MDSSSGYWGRLATQLGDSTKNESKKEKSVSLLYRLLKLWGYNVCSIECLN